jgi:hypothetical protein
MRTVNTSQQGHYFYARTSNRQLRAASDELEEVSASRYIEF